ncbi:MAG: oligosaccharide flippase family protein [Mesorhizobium sp.]
MIGKKFLKNASLLAFASAVSQAVLVAATPFLTRLYSPEQFGHFAAFLAVLSVLGVLATMRYEVAIALPESDEDSDLILILCMAIVAAVTVITAVSVLVAHEFVAQNGIDRLYFLLPVGLFLTGLYQAMSYRALRGNAFRTVGVTRVTQSIATVILQLAAFKMGSVGLISGHVAGRAVGMLSLARITTGNFAALVKRSNIARCWNLAVEYRNFPIFSTSAGFVNQLSGNVLPLVLVAVYGPASAGLYALAARVVAAPSTLIGGAISDVFLPGAAAAHRTTGFTPMVESANTALIRLGVPPAFLLAVIAPDLFQLVFGAAWAEAGDIARWLVPWLLLALISAPISTVCGILGRQRSNLIFQTCLLAVRIGAIGAGVAMDDPRLTIIMFSAVSAVAYAWFWGWLMRLSGVSIQRQVEEMLKATGISILLASPAIYYEFLSEGHSIGEFIGWFAVSSVMILAWCLMTIRKIVGSSE